MKIGIYGGSFNPIHFGHTGLAIYIAEHTDIDEVWLMVTPNNPLKDKGVLAPEEDRYKAACAAMNAAVKEREKQTGKRLKPIRVSDFEFTLPKPNYTARTLKALKAAYPEDEFCLIIGEDNLRCFTRWRDYEYIGEHYPIYVYPRQADKESGQASDSDRPQAIDTTFIKEIHYLKEAPLFDISSTRLREAQKGSA